MGVQAVFLDRDGTINVEKHYLHRIEEFEFLPDALHALRLLKEAGFRLILVTNQSGIARGYYTEEDLARLHAWMRQALREQGIELDGVYYCPHHPEAAVPAYRKDCMCRKPGLGLFERAILEHEIDLSRSFCVGDKLRDCALCASTSCRGFLIGENETDEILRRVKDGKIERVQWAKNLLECAEKIRGLTACREREENA